MLALLISTAIKWSHTTACQRERGERDGEDEQDSGGREGGRGEKKKKKNRAQESKTRKEVRDGERERKEGIRPEIPSLIIVCCDKPL